MILKVKTRRYRYFNMNSDITRILWTLFPKSRDFSETELRITAVRSMLFISIQQCWVHSTAYIVDAKLKRPEATSPSG